MFIDGEAEVAKVKVIVDNPWLREDKR